MTSTDIFVSQLQHFILCSCDSGFYLNGTDVAMCLETGEWFPEPPHCHRLRCSEPQALDHVTFTVESLPEVGDIATLSEAEYHG